MAQSVASFSLQPPPIRRRDAGPRNPTFCAVRRDRAGTAGGAATSAAVPFSSLLQSCIDSGSLEEGIRVHEQILAAGFRPDSYLQTKILMLYARAGTPLGLSTARKMFDEMSQRNSTAWNTMIIAYAKEEVYGETLDLFLRMQISGASPDGFTFPSAIKACTVLRLRNLLLQIHSMILKAGLRGDLIAGTALVESYAELGSMAEVLRAFAEVSCPNFVTWNAVLGACANRRLWREAWEVLQAMEIAGIPPNHSTLAYALRACGGLKTLSRGEQIHAKVISHGFMDDIFLCNCLIGMYASCGESRRCRKVFDEMPERDQATWNTIISEFFQLGLHEETFSLFHRMQKESFKADGFTLASIIKACSILSDPIHAREIHGYLLRRCLDSDLILGSAMVDLYGKIGSMDDAYAVFDGLKQRNEVSWNALISGYVQKGSFDNSLELFNRMRVESYMPDQFTYSSMLGMASEHGDVKLGRQIHSLVIKTVSNPNLVLETELVHVYCRCRGLDDGMKIFSRMAVKNAYSWNHIIEGYARDDHPIEALMMFQQMRMAGIKPDAFSVSGVLLACMRIYGGGEFLKEIHGFAVRNTIMDDGVLSIRVLDAYLKTGNMLYAQKFYKNTLNKDADFHNVMLSALVNGGKTDEAMEVFERMEGRDTSSWSCILIGCMKEGRRKDAFLTFQRMLGEGVDFSNDSMVPLLKICAGIPSVETGKQLHACVVKKGVNIRSVNVDNSLVDMYAKSGHIEEASKHFGQMREKSVVAWNTMISAYAQHGQTKEALRIFEEMKREKALPNRLTFLSLLSCCSHTGFVREGLDIFRSMVSDYGIEVRGEHYACMVDLLGRAGQLRWAKELIERMPVEPDVATWGALLAASRIHGDVSVAKLAASKLLELDPKNAAHYILMQNIYLAAGKSEEAEKIKKMMREKAKREVGVSWIEVNNKVSVFHCNDRSHANSDEICSILKCLYREESMSKSRQLDSTHRFDLIEGII